MGRAYAGILGPLAFTVTLARGVIGGGGTAPTLMMATCSLFLFALIGYISGRIADAIVMEAVKTKFHDELQAREQAAETT